MTMTGQSPKHKEPPWRFGAVVSTWSSVVVAVTGAVGESLVLLVLSLVTLAAAEMMRSQANRVQMSDRKRRGLL